MERCSRSEKRFRYSTVYQADSTAHAHTPTVNQNDCAGHCRGRYCAPLFHATNEKLAKMTPFLFHSIASSGKLSAIQALCLRGGQSKQLMQDASKHYRAGWHGGCSERLVGAGKSLQIAGVMMSTVNLPGLDRTTLVCTS